MYARVRNYLGKSAERKVLAGKTIIHSNPQSTRIGAFISVPKNASKSVLNSLDLGPNRDLETTTSLVIYENHQRAEVLSRKYDLSGLYVFCFSRNPYDRCVSWFSYHRLLAPYKNMTFKEWITAGMPHHLEKQNTTDYIQDGISPLLQVNYTKGVEFDFVGSFEKFSRDLAIVVQQLNNICEQRGLKHRFPLKVEKLNTSSRSRDLDKYYDRYTKEIVYRLLEEDFEMFSYDKL